MLVEAVDRLLLEAAKKPADLQAFDAKVRIEKHGKEIWVQLVRDGAPLTIRDKIHGMVVIHKAPFKTKASATHFRVSFDCGGAYVVQLTHATKGWGPLLYDVAIEYASKHGGGVAPDRWQVSHAAQQVWSYYLNRRSDVKAHQLDNPSNELTPTKADNCTQDSAFNFPDDPLSKRYTKSGTPVINKLKKLGLLETKEFYVRRFDK